MLVVDGYPREEMIKLVTGKGKRKILIASGYVKDSTRLVFVIYTKHPTEWKEYEDANRYIDSSHSSNEVITDAGSLVTELVTNVNNS